MAFVTDSFSDVSLFGGFTPFNRKSRKMLLSGVVVGAGTVAFAWTVATVLTMQTMVASIGSAPVAQSFSSLRSIALTDSVQRMQIAALSAPSREQRARTIAEYAAAIRKKDEAPTVAVARTGRLHGPAAAIEQAAAERSVPKAVRAQLIMRLAMANAAASPTGDIVAYEPNRAPAATSLDHPHTVPVDIAAAAPTRTKDDLVVASASADAPQTPAVPTQNQALASATPDDGFAAIVPPIPTARPDDADTIMTASIETPDTDDSDSDNAGGGSASDAFNLVLSNPDSAVPTPMARPDGSPRNALPAGRSRNAPETALAYARTDDDDDDDAPEIPSVRKPQAIVPRLNAGVAVYDISAGMVYLPGGERLEAHSGMGAMRDNPRFVNQKNRGPTPPHTYALTLRESLFHGIQAIRLTPLGGQGAVYNRVGLLAHTYMLARRGDSNGCVVFKDYNRFLAAYRRGDISKMVVVKTMADLGNTATAEADRPRGLFGGLFRR